MLPELTQRLLESWPALGLNRRCPREVHYLGLPGSIEGGTATFLAFGDTDREPFCAIKVHRGNRTAALAQAEAATLRRLSVLPAIASSVPRALFSGSLTGAAFLVQTVVPGRPMSATVGQTGVPDRRAAERNYRIAHDWLAGLHLATRSADPQAIDGAADAAADAIERYRRVFGFSSRSAAAAAHMERNLRAVIAAGVSLGHGDFCRHNLLVQGEPPRLGGVIDWTFARAYAPALHDLFFFAATYFLQIRTRNGIEGFAAAFENTFRDANPYGDLVSAVIRSFCAQCGIDSEAIAPAFLLFLIEQSVLEYGRTAACGAEGMLPRFNLHLAKAEGRNYAGAAKMQFWPRFVELACSGAWRLAA